MFPARLPRWWFLVRLCALLSFGPFAAYAAEVGTLAGVVNNRATGDLLEGAKISVPQLGVTALTDNTGRFVLADLPAGTHEVVASYVGLDPMRSQVVIVAGQRATRDFDLTTG